ncbi:MAG: ABC transporter permease, partial [Leptospiraceae bacterium]|nr:ABC transporter permease [Leptospiraceae bacterium]
MNSFLLIWSLCKRDYAIQFAGSILGLFWVVIQSVVLISLYLMIFWVLDIHPTSKASSISYIITGILFWLPIQEFLNRGTVILTENRQLIKKTGLGVNIFLKVPLFQMYLHFLILSIPCYIVLYFLGSLNLSFFFVSFIWYIILGLILYPIISYLGRANVILKDISPVIRLFLQVLFWGSPLLY